MSMNTPMPQTPKPINQIMESPRDAQGSPIILTPREIMDQLGPNGSRLIESGALDVPVSEMTDVTRYLLSIAGIDPVLQADKKRKGEPAKDKKVKVDEEVTAEISTPPEATETKDERTKRLIEEANKAARIAHEARIRAEAALIGEPDVDNPDIATDDTIEPDEAMSSEEFRNRIAEAGSTFYIEGTTVPVGELDPEYLDRFPVPTYANTFVDGRYPQEFDFENHIPLLRSERALRRTMSTLRQVHESIYDTNSNESEMNKKYLDLLKRLEETGNDSQIRNLFAEEIEPGRWVNPYSGASVDYADVVDAQNNWGVNYEAFQMAWWYELINKAQNEGDFNIALTRGLAIINDALSRKPFGDPAGPRWTERQVMGMIKGLEFMGKIPHLSFKHANIKYSKTSNNEGHLEYRGVKAVDFVRELTGKFQGYSVGALSTVDAENTATIAQQAYETCIRYRDIRTANPEVLNAEKRAIVERLTADLGAKPPLSHPELKKINTEIEHALRLRRAQFVLQRLSKQVSDMRIGLMGAEAADSDAYQSALALSKAFSGSGPRSSAVKFNPKTGELELKRGGVSALRTGGSATTAPMWEVVATYTDAAQILFPNLRYADRNESKMLESQVKSDARVQYLVTKETDKLRKSKGRNATSAELEKIVEHAKAEVAMQATGLADEEKDKRTPRDRKKARGKVKKQAKKERRSRNKQYAQRAKEIAREDIFERDEEKNAAVRNRVLQERAARARAAKALRFSNISTTRTSRANVRTTKHGSSTRPVRVVTPKRKLSSY